MKRLIISAFILTGCGTDDSSLQEKDNQLNSQQTLLQQKDNEIKLLREKIARRDSYIGRLEFDIELLLESRIKVSRYNREFCNYLEANHPPLYSNCYDEQLYQIPEGQTHYTNKGYSPFKGPNW